MVNLPIIGTVRAGMPQPAEEEIEGYLALDPTLAPQEDAFLLRVKGDSMIEAGILEGDLALVRPQSTADNGDIVIALVDGEATMKQFLRLPGAIQLKPANRHFSPIIIPADGPELAIIGRVTTIIRQLA
jgi:repressor LexA